MSENRRTTTRYDVSIAAKLTIVTKSDEGESEGPVQELNLSNLSLGGAFVDTDERISIGTRVKLEFPVPGKPEPIVVGGDVRWGAPTGVGIQFDGLRAKEVWSLNQFFETLA